MESREKLGYDFFKNQDGKCVFLFLAFLPFVLEIMEEYFHLLRRSKSFTTNVANGVNFFENLQME